jgi:hypothetical protein
MTTPSSAARRPSGGGGGAGDGLGEVEEGGVFLAAEILGAEQLLEADDLGAAGGGFADAPFGLGEVFVGVGGAGHLHQADAECNWLRPPRPSSTPCLPA